VIDGLAAKNDNDVHGAPGKGTEIKTLKASKGEKTKKDNIFGTQIQA